jgi:predicted PurR-regulated permease PerM
MESKQIEKQFFVALLLIALGLVFFIFLPYLDAIVLAVTLAILSNPFYRSMRKAMPRWEGIAAFLTVMLAVVVILTPLTFFGFRIFGEAQQLYVRFASGDGGTAFTAFSKQVEQFAPWLKIDITSNTKQILGALIQNLGVIFSKLAGVIGTFFLALIALYYFLKDGAKLRRAIVQVSPLSLPHTEEILAKLGVMANSVIKGSLVIAIIQGVLVGLGFLVFGVPNPVFWGAVSIIASLIPFLGTAIVVVPAVIYLFVGGNTIPAFGLVGWGIFAVGLIDNFLRPQFIERDAKIHPFLVLLSVLGGIALFGMTGFLLGPLVLSLLLALLDIYPSLILERDHEHRA